MKVTQQPGFSIGLGAGLLSGMAMTLTASVFYLAASGGGSFLEAGEPPYLDHLRASGMPVTKLSDERLSSQGLRGWEVQRLGDRVFAYAPKDSQSVILGGVLYSDDMRDLGKEIEVAHQRQQVTLADIAEEATWISLGDAGQFKPAKAYLVVDPSTPDARQAYSALLETEHDLSALRLTAYPESRNEQGMPASLAIYEADYRTPEGESPVITERRGGDLQFTHHPHEVLTQVLLGDNFVRPLAPPDHPAEVQAIQSISAALYLKDRLDIPSNSVLLEKNNQNEGPAWEIYPLLPVKGWINQLD